MALGIVLDASGALIPGVEVKATKIDTGVTATGMSNEAGKYTIRFLLPGAYRVVAGKTGL